MGRLRIMTPLTAASSAPPLLSFEVRFANLFRPGRSLAFPCDGAGHVDMDMLSARARANYLFARAMVGRDLALPCICQREAAFA